MTTEVCPEVYTRPDLMKVRCTYIRGHAAEHSFRTLQVQDRCDAERERALAEPDGDLPADVEAILENITEGRADPYLEAILAVTHNRKKALRNVPGFVRRER
jgi:hypothetical protein